MGLYYPCHFFSDDSWLKAAALYWPQMVRIVAEGHQVQDSVTAEALADELGFIVNIDPVQAAQAVAPMMSDVLSQSGGDLQRRYNVDLESASRRFIWSEPKSFDEIPAAQFQPPGETISYEEAFEEVVDYHGNALVAVHPAEIQPSLRADLITAGLAFEYRSWLAMRCEVAWAYKCVLAEEVARQNLLSPTTDQTLAYCASHGWTVERVKAALLPDSWHLQRPIWQSRTNLGCSQSRWHCLRIWNRFPYRRSCRSENVIVRISTLSARLSTTRPRNSVATLRISATPPCWRLISGRR